MKNYRYKERRDRMVKKIGFWITEIVLLISAAYLIVSFCLQTVTVHGESMQPSYYDNDTVLVDKISYRFKEPERYDAVLIELENGTSTHFSIKRVIGLPGETVEITDGKIYVDGKPLDFSFEEDILSAGQAAYGVTLGKDEYFVMGDNCNNSEDSRAANIGNIKFKQFDGKILGKIF